MSFALVYWLKACTTSIIDVHSIPKSSANEEELAVNDLVCAPLGFGFYTAKILRISDDYELLNMTKVSGNGEIVQESIDGQEKETQNWDDYVDGSSPEDTNKEKPKRDKKRKNESHHRDTEKKSKIQKDSIRDMEQRLLLIDDCDAADVNAIEKSSDIPDNMDSSQKSHSVQTIRQFKIDSNQNERKKVFVVETEDGSLKVEELQRGSGVYVNYEKLKMIKKELAHKPNEMIRQLLKILVDCDELKNMTALGTKSGRKAVPVNILKAVKDFTDRKSVPICTTSQYHKVINKYCDRLRNPKKQYKNTTDDRKAFDCEK